jgi:hypothetical protein
MPRKRKRKCSICGQPYTPRPKGRLVSDMPGFYGNIGTAWFSWSPPLDVPSSTWQGMEQARRNEGTEIDP